MIDKKDINYQRTKSNGRKITKTHCSGCDQDRYNHPGMCERPGIDATVTSKECWHLESAMLVKRKQVSINLTPPWTMKPITVPSCYSMRGYVFIDPKRTC